MDYRKLLGTKFHGLNADELECVGIVGADRFEWCAGKLARYTSIGCYTIGYHRTGDILCAHCATAALLEGDTVEAFGQWEDPHCYCSECDAHIEPSYSVDGEE